MRQKGMVYLMSVYFWTELFATSAILFPVAFLVWLVTMPFDPRRKILHQFSCLWSNLAFWLNPWWELQVSGKIIIRKSNTYIIVANHQSGADILVLFTLRLHFKWVAKRSLFFFPFIGWNMAMNRYIALRRGKKSSMHLMMERSKQELLKGNSMMIFPEGTRSPDGRLQSFRSGAFHLAIETNLPVLPVVIKNTSKAIRKGGFLIAKRHDLKAVILEPVMPESFKGMDAKQLALKVHQLFSRELQDHSEPDHGKPVSRPLTDYPVE